ncbi:MAG: hypothetical protein QOH16_1856 [Gaiellaceae bacterium]|jgi:hypothetical protein|nr:hypothetical protein [Gaiellaceae bacterium]
MVGEDLSPARKLTLFLLGSVAFGVIMAVIKGQDVGVRDALGNLSAPWIVIPFLAATRYRSVWRATLVGVATTLAALLGFYVAEAAILDLGAHPWYIDLKLTAGSVNIYEKSGVFSGALYGALGGLWATRRSVLAAATVGLAFLGEPAITFVISRGGLWGGGGLLDYAWMWVGEIVVGLGAIACVIRLATVNKLESGSADTESGSELSRLPA